MWEQSGQCSFSSALISVGLFSIHYTNTHMLLSQSDNKRAVKHVYIWPFIYICAPCLYLSVCVCSFCACNEVNLLRRAKTSVSLSLLHGQRIILITLNPLPLVLHRYTHWKSTLCFCWQWVYVDCAVGLSNMQHKLRHTQPCTDFLLPLKVFHIPWVKAQRNKSISCF